MGAVMSCIGYSPSGFAEMTTPPITLAGWVIEAADYTGEVRDQIVRLEGRYTIRVLKDGWTEIPFAIQGATITAIDINKKTGDAHLAPRGQSYVLLASRKGSYKVHVKFSATLAQDSQFEGVRFGIPQATFSTLSLFVPRKDVELRPQDQLYVEHATDGQRGGVTLLARLGASEQVSLQWRTKPATPVKIEPVLYGEVHTLVSVEEQLARLMSIIEYRMAQGETKELLIQLPSAINVLNVRGAGIDDWHVNDADGHKKLAVTLKLALKDATYRLIVEGEQTMADGATDYVLPGIQLSGVRQERGYLAISRAGNVELLAQTMEGINRVDVKELPELLRASMGAPAILAFKYQQHPYRVALALRRHQDHAVLAAIAERGELESVLSQQGEMLTRASYLIKANKKQYLSVVLPEGATLWSCIVDGKSVKPVDGKSHELLVPLDTMTEAAEAVPVELVYFEQRPALINVGHLNLQGPVLDVPTTIANWSVYAPHEIKFLRVSGNLQKGLAPFEFLEEPFVQTAFAQTGVDRGAVKKIERSMFYGMIGKKPNLTFSRKAKFDSKDDYGAYENEPQSAASLGDTAHMPAGVTESDEQLNDVIEELSARAQETGILPLKIRLPKSGKIYRFSRLMTTQDVLKLDATFVHVRMPWLFLAACGLLLLPVGGVIFIRFARR
jgi:hypothetical protein